LAGKKKLGKSKLFLNKAFKDIELVKNYKGYLSFYDGVMDDELLGNDLINLAKELKINLYENHEVSFFDIYGNIDNEKFEKVILAVGPWTKILLKKNNINPSKEIDYIKGSHLIINRKIKSALMFKGVCQSRYIFALPYKENVLLGTTEVRVNSPDEPKININEKNYLVDSINTVLKNPISSNDIISTYSGVRPLIKSKNNFHESSRDFYIQQDSNLISIFGGKWTTSPSIARKIATII
jgi:Glycerol-3-phosphate dehydrogenase